MTSCTHFWVSADNLDHRIRFRVNRQISSEPVTYVLCTECGARMWFTQAQWDGLPEGWPSPQAQRFVRELQGDFSEVDAHLRQQRQLLVAVAFIVMVAAIAVAVIHWNTGG